MVEKASMCVDQRQAMIRELKEKISKYFPDDIHNISYTEEKINISVNKKLYGKKICDYTDKYMIICEKLTRNVDGKEDKWKIFDNKIIPMIENEFNNKN